MNVSDLSAAQLRRAATLKDQIEKLQKELAGLLGSSAVLQVSVAVPRPKKRKLSAATRRKMAEAHKARWAKIKAARK